LDELARHRWIAIHILPLESQVRRWLSRHVRSLATSDADDLIQEAYSRIWGADFATIHNPRAYFFQTVRNLLQEQARHAQIVPMERMGEIDALRIPSEDPGPERRIGARQELERLTALVRALPAQCRRTFELRKIYELSQREVAALMGISERTVEKHLEKALDRVLQRVAGGERNRDSERDRDRENTSEAGTDGT
jgi:RNA polymerase sigma factor (sigma-70 family)